MENGAYLEKLQERYDRANQIRYQVSRGEVKEGELWSYTQKVNDTYNVEKVGTAEPLALNPLTISNLNAYVGASGVDESDDRNRARRVGGWVDEISPIDSISQRGVNDSCATYD